MIMNAGDGLPDTNNDGVYMDWCGCCGLGTTNDFKMGIDNIGIYTCGDGDDECLSGTSCGAGQGSSGSSYCGSASTDLGQCCDCVGTPNGNVLVDDCGNCGGDCWGSPGDVTCGSSLNNTTTADCAGFCGTTNMVNDCGECVTTGGGSDPNPGLECPDAYGIEYCSTVEDLCPSPGGALNSITPGDYCDCNCTLMVDECQVCNGGCFGGTF